MSLNTADGKLLPAAVTTNVTCQLHDQRHSTATPHDCATAVSHNIPICTVEKYGGYGDSVKSPGYSVFSDDTASLYSGDDLEVHGGSHGHGHGRGGADERGGGAGGGGGGARMTGYLERFTGASSVRGIALAVPRDELLYPTLTLHSPHTQGKFSCRA